MRTHIHVGLYVKRLLISFIPIETNTEVDRKMSGKITPNLI
jgi:hypothetical protein